MAQYLSVYTNNPTEGAKDGTAVSENGAQTSPIDVTLNAAENESKTIKIAVRCADGYKTSGQTVLYFSGYNESKWKICDTEDGVYNQGINITGEIGDTNKILYVKVSSSSDENPTNDTGVSLVCYGTVVQA